MDSVSSSQFREFRDFSAIAENHWPYYIHQYYFFYFYTFLDTPPTFVANLILSFLTRSSFVTPQSTHLSQHRHFHHIHLLLPFPHPSLLPLSLSCKHTRDKNGIFTYVDHSVTNVFPAGFAVGFISEWSPRF